MSEAIEKTKLTIELGERTIKMTYGLSMDLRRMLPDPASAMSLIMSDPFTQDYIIRRCLTDAKKMITDEKELISQDDVDLDMDQIEDLLQWVVSHVMDFFVTRSSRLKTTGERYKSLLPSQSKAGSENSASTTASAGPSE